MRGNDILLLSRLGTHKQLDVSANPRGLRTSNSDPENSDRQSPATPPLADSGGCDQIRRDRACIRPASPRPNGQKEGAPSRAQARWLPPNLRSGLTREQMITGPIEENLRLILQPAKRARVNDACAIALKFSAIGVARLGVLPPTRVTGFLSKRREHVTLRCLDLRTRLPSLVHHWECRLLWLSRRRIVRDNN